MMVSKEVIALRALPYTSVESMRDFAGDYFGIDSEGAWITDARHAWHPLREGDVAIEYDEGDWGVMSAGAYERFFG
jgi:hypothetical protein